MRGLLAASIAIIAASGPAYGADAARKSSVTSAKTTTASVPSFSWTGCYLGGHLGGGYGDKQWSNARGFELSNSMPLFGDSPFFSDQHVSGFLAGGQAGCKLQLAPKWVIGFEGEFSGAEMIGFQQLVPSAIVNAVEVGLPTTLRTKTDWVASATGNLGYAFDRLLLYGKVGAAWARDKYSMTVDSGGLPGINPADFEAQETRTGWTAGAGIEYAFWKNLSARLEYDFYNFGTKNVHFVDQLSATASSGDVDIKQHIHAVKLALNYYFWNEPAPAAATSSATMPVKAPVAAAAAASTDMTWNQTFASEFRYFTWHSNRGYPANTISSTGQPVTAPGSGTELYIPYASQLVGQSNDFKVEMLGRGGWVQARQSTAGLAGNVATATDTVASGTVTYLGLQGIQPFASINFNLPTGQSFLPNTAANARMDPDLVDIATFGEGLNIGPTLGFNLPLTSLFLVTMSAGYTHRGAFDRENPLTSTGNPGQTATNIEPGEVFTVTGSVGYQLNQLTGKLTGTITKQTATKENFMPFVQPGKQYLVEGSLAYAWPMEHIGVTTLSGSLSHAKPNEVLFLFVGAPTSLMTEPFNTNSNLYRAGLEHLFTIDQVAFGPRGSFLFRDHNAYDPTTIQFVPAKERWTAGVLARYAPNQTLTVNARAERVWVHENENPALPGDQKFSVLVGNNQTAFTVPVVSSTGWQFAVGATATF
jgi:opacity protein-like surface antigen